MHWPIGIPKVYACSKRATSSSERSKSGDRLRDDDEDGLQRLQTSESVSSQDIARRDSEAVPVNGGLKPESRRSNRTQETARPRAEDVILSAKVSRGGHIFATITRMTLTVWQTKPTVILASAIRSKQSMNAYGASVAFHLRPDSLVIVVQTSLGFLITYSIGTDPNARVYQTDLPASGRNVRKASADGYSAYGKRQDKTIDAEPAEGEGIKEVNIRYRMVVRIDAGITRALTLDEELIVATKSPASVQCIRWPQPSVSKTAGTQRQPKTSTELLLDMHAWLVDPTCALVEMVHDRPMNLMCWIMSDGRAYAVQRRDKSNIDVENSQGLFQGYCFRAPAEEATENGAASSGLRTAMKAAINARFSLIAVGCANGDVEVFAVKNYMGNIPFSHKMQTASTSDALGSVTFLTYSPDGYVLLAGFEKGWAMWSVYGKLLTSSANVQGVVNTSSERASWLKGITGAFWTGGGCELFLLPEGDDRVWCLDIARSAIAGSYSNATTHCGLLVSSTNLRFYNGHKIVDLTALPSDMSLWQTVHIPNSYMRYQWPIKVAVISEDRTYIAVAGRRGLAHFSTISSRWRTFDDIAAEHEFAVRGGMVWYRHYLIACTETATSDTRSKSHQIRIYDRGKPLDAQNIAHCEDLSAPAIFITVTGTDSLLVYTYDNILLHYIIVLTASSIKIVQVGQIGFHGIIRAPPRVRAVSWILPEAQIEHGDPSQDVATASIIFLVDGKLVLLQPTTNEFGELKYDMRVIAQNVEYYTLLRDHPGAFAASTINGNELASELPVSSPFDDTLGHSLRDSLWYFDGLSMYVWSDVQDVLACAPAELGRDLPIPVSVNVDFYPLNVMVTKGIINGLDSELVQRRDVDFSFWRLNQRTTLLLPHLLRDHIAEYNSPAALHLSHSYQHLPYFPHALEVLLHDILDQEVDDPPDPPETALLPGAVAFLSSFSSYLEILVNCTRKTELRSWRTLFSYLPPVLELFEQSLALGQLKTAAGYLLVLHTFEEQSDASLRVVEFARLLHQATAAEDWDICKELARFLMGIDGSGTTLKTVMQEAELIPGGSGMAAERQRAASSGSRLVNGHDSNHAINEESIQRAVLNEADTTGGPFDYFSTQRDHGEHDVDNEYATSEVD